MRPEQPSDLDEVVSESRVSAYFWVEPLWEAIADRCGPARFGRD